MVLALSELDRPHARTWRDRLVGIWLAGGADHAAAQSLAQHGVTLACAELEALVWRLLLTALTSQDYWRRVTANVAWRRLGFSVRLDYTAQRVTFTRHVS